MSSAMTVVPKPAAAKGVEVLARLPLPRPALARLKQLNIYCETRVSLETRRDKRAVLRAVESGGAVHEMGHYVLFCDPKGQPLPWLQQIQSLVANGRHAVIVAESLVSVEVFRYRHTYQLLIVEHSSAVEARRRQLFLGRDGTLPLDLSGADVTTRGAIAPEFFTRSGERREFPAMFVDAVKIATAAVNTINVTKALYARAADRAE